MQNFVCWLTPSPGYEQHGEIHPISTTLYYVSRHFGRRPETSKPLPESAQAIIMPEEKVDALLRHDAEGWSYFKTGDDAHPERYDAGHAHRLFKAYKEQLERVGFLNFTIPCAGITV